MLPASPPRTSPRSFLPFTLRFILIVVASSSCKEDQSAADAGARPDPRVLYCAVVQACALLPSRGFSTCVSSDDGPPAAVQACLAAAGASCAAARRCTFDGREAGPSLCRFGEKP